MLFFLDSRPYSNKMAKPPTQRCLHTEDPRFYDKLPYPNLTIPKNWLSFQDSKVFFVLEYIFYLQPTGKRKPKKKKTWRMPDLSHTPSEQSRGSPMDQWATIVGRNLQPLGVPQLPSCASIPLPTTRKNGSQQRKQRIFVIVWGSYCWWVFFVV